MYGKRICSLSSSPPRRTFLPLAAPMKSGRQQPGPLVSGVQTETVHLESAPQLYQAVGAIRSANTAILAAQVGGTVREIRVQAGDHVKRGQLLAVLDDRSAQAQVQGAEAGVNEAIQGEAEVEQALKAATADRQFAEATFNRYKELLAKNSLSRQEFDGAEARYQAALANERCHGSQKTAGPGSPAAGALAAGFRANLPQLLAHCFAPRRHRDRKIRGCGNGGHARHAGADGGRHGTLSPGSEPAGGVSPHR